MNKLSARFVETNKKPGLSNDGLGLYLKTQKTGAKSWIFRYASPVTRRKRDMGLGTYPVVSLAQARQETLKLRLLLSQGLDPIRVRDEERAAYRQEHETPDFASFATEHHAEIKDQWKNKKHAQQWINTLTRYAFPVIGKMQMGHIDVNDVLSVLKPIWKTKTETATRVRQRIEDVWNAAKLRGYVSGDNPARWKGHLVLVLPAPAKIRPVKHHDAMLYKDVPAFVSRLRASSSLSAMALEFLILTACRTSEVRLAVWGEIDLENRVWTIPKERMKAGREHRVPLSDRCVEILDGLSDREGYLFKKLSSGKPLGDGAFRALMGRMGAGANTPHGFRSSFRDWAAELSQETPDVIEMALGHHVGSKTERAYFRSDQLVRRRLLLENWNAFLQPTQMPKVV
ncbi:integrase arm-type DNA-binding domain-containing protein [Litorivicinus sp.]|nr:integrase arm-type DNA-binding domain-containing protein [Litorivicinus sp.]